MMATEPWRFDGEEDWDLLDLDSFFQVPSDHEVTSKEGDESTSESEGVWRSDMESKEGDAVSTPESEGMWRTNPAVERDLRLLELPKKLCHSFNCGDLDLLASQIGSSFHRDCTLKTPALDKPVRGSQFVVAFFKSLLEGHPDGVLALERSSFDRSKNVVAKLVFTGTCIHNGKDAMPDPNSFLITKGNCKTLGWITSQIIQGVRRHFFPSERQRLERMEQKVLDGTRNARFEIHVVVLYQLRKGTDCIGQMEMKWKMKKFTAVEP